MCLMIEDEDRVEDYKPYEIARIWKVSTATIRRRIDRGDFGQVDVDWHWSGTKHGEGIRLVHANTVRRMLRERLDKKGG